MLEKLISIRNLPSVTENRALISVLTRKVVGAEKLWEMQDSALIRRFTNGQTNSKNLVRAA
jgi:hypothetical protein